MVGGLVVLEVNDFRPKRLAMSNAVCLAFAFVIWRSLHVRVAQRWFPGTIFGMLVLKCVAFKIISMSGDHSFGNKQTQWSSAR